MCCDGVVWCGARKVGVFSESKNMAHEKKQGLGAVSTPSSGY
jgi:hypothetical protein